LEVPDEAGANIRSLAGAKARAQSFAPLLAVLVAAGAFVLAQPVGSPWWLWADNDGMYSASALNIASGVNTRYFDHPGLPEQEVLALTFAAVSLPDGGPTRSWTTSEMTHLDRARPVFRGWAIAIFIGGALLMYEVLRRFLGHWTWGLAGGLLWLAQPDLSGVLQVRPDILVAVLGLLAVATLVRAYEHRSAIGYAAAAAIVGVSMMTKLQGGALLLALVLAAALGHPQEGWWPRTRNAIGEFGRRHLLALTLAVIAWVALFVFFNRGRFSVETRHSYGLAVAIAGFVALDYVLATIIVQGLPRHRLLRGVFDPLYVVIGTGLLVGLLLPLSFVLHGSVYVLGQTIDGLRGGGINAGIKPFAVPATRYIHYPLLETMVVAVVAGVAAIIGIRRRDARPVLWFAAAAPATILAAARLAEWRYFALGYATAIPAALWLFRRRTAVVAPVAVWVLVAAVLVPTLVHVRDPADAARREEGYARAVTRLADRVLGPNDVAILPDYAPNSDVRWSLVEKYVNSPPRIRYRFVSAGATSLEPYLMEGQRVRAFIAPGAQWITKPETITTASGTYHVRPIDGGRSEAAAGIGAVEIVSGPIG
jgi:predicted membrane protein